MPTPQKDTEITLGMGRMLAIFFALVLVCALFFSLGFSLGKRTSAAVGTTLQNSPNASSSPAGLPPAAKSNPRNSAAARDQKAQSAASETNSTAVSKASPVNYPTPQTLSSGTYYVQVAAVTRQEDADSLVEALKRKQYPVGAVKSASSDKYFHVQVGPYAELKDAETMRQRLIGDGYNPIVKK
jgi:DedD protein